MTKIITLRLKEKELGFIRSLSEKEDKDRSFAARQLINYGWTYFVLKQYKECKISIEKVAKELNLSITEIIELLSELGIKSPVTYEEYLEGYNGLRKVF